MDTQTSRYTHDEKENISLRLNALQLAFEKEQQKPVLLFLLAVSDSGFDILVSDSEVAVKYVIDGMIQLFPQYLQRSGMPPDLQLALGLSIIANLDEYLSTLNHDKNKN